LINGVAEEESIYDCGSQIVSMAQAVAEQLGLVWDPDVNIYMQSANGQTEKSVGLARNVPFKFGDLTLHLQVHIIRDPAYKVLLGRPFDMLTESEVSNKTDGRQLITLRDPVTRQRNTIPTFERGAPKLLRRAQRDASTEIKETLPASGNFQASMN
jgi:hypothetical protein